MPGPLGGQGLSNCSVSDEKEARLLEPKTKKRKSCDIKNLQTYYMNQLSIIMTKYLKDPSTYKEKRLILVMISEVSGHGWLPLLL